jgi:hypothetical protein
VAIGIAIYGRHRRTRAGLAKNPPAGAAPSKAALTKTALAKTPLAKTAPSKAALIRTALAKTR